MMLFETSDVGHENAAVRIGVKLRRSTKDIALCDRLLAKISTPARSEYVASIKDSIDHDTYENALKVEIAVERLLVELDGDHAWCTVPLNPKMPSASENALGTAWANFLSEQ